MASFTIRVVHKSPLRTPLPAIEAVNIDAAFAMALAIEKRIRAGSRPPAGAPSSIEILDGNDLLVIGVHV